MTKEEAREVAEIVVAKYDFSESDLEIFWRIVEIFLEESDIDYEDKRAHFENDEIFNALEEFTGKTDIE